MNKKIILLVLVFLLLTGCTSITDKALLKRVNKESKMMNVPIDEIESLDCSNLNIQTLNGIRSLKSLKRINLSNNHIVDISELSYLEHLESVNLQNNQIVDITPLSDIMSLNTLYIRNNPIEKFASLDHIKNGDMILNNSFDPILEQIIKEKVGDNITNFNILGIKELDLLGTEVRSLKYIDAFKNLEILRADYVTDLEDIKNLHNLKELYLRKSNITDLNILHNLVKLRRLDLSDNMLEDIQPIKNLKRLKYLNLQTNNISDVSALNDLALEEVYLKYNPIEDYSSADKMLENVFKTDVYIAYFNDENLNDAILDILKIKNTYISKTRLNKIKSIDLSNKEIESIGGIENLSSLIELDLSFNDIEDIQYVKDLKNLKILRLNNNNISDISPLSYLSNMELLDLSFNTISSVEALLFLPELKYLYIKGNIIDDNSIKEELKNKLEITDEW